MCEPNFHIQFVLYSYSNDFTSIGSFGPVSYVALLETSLIYCIHFSLSHNCISHQILSIKAHNGWLLPKVLPKPI